MNHIVSARPRVAVIGTGGTIASVGKDSLDTIDYASNERILDVKNLLALTPELERIADVCPIPFSQVVSSQIGFANWKALAALCNDITSKDMVSGIVILHGTSSMEETAFALSLCLDIDIPVVLTGSQRPAKSVSGDGPMNLVNAVRVAASAEARRLGVLVVMNDEIHGARDVTKSSNFRLHAFISPDYGPLGHVDGQHVRIRRRMIEDRVQQVFDIASIERLPRVDIISVHCDADGVAAEAFMKAGAQGLVVAGMAPGVAPASMIATLETITGQGFPVVMSSRAGSGDVHLSASNLRRGLISARDLSPHKARVFLSFGLTRTRDFGELAAMF